MAQQPNSTPYEQLLGLQEQLVQLKFELNQEIGKRKQTRQRIDDMRCDMENLRNRIKDDRARLIPLQRRFFQDLSLVGTKGLEKYFPNSSQRDGEEAADEAQELDQYPVTQLLEISDKARQVADKTQRNVSVISAMVDSMREDLNSIEAIESDLTRSMRQLSEHNSVIGKCKQQIAQLVTRIGACKQALMTVITRQEEDHFKAHRMEQERIAQLKENDFALKEEEDSETRSRFVVRTERTSTTANSRSISAPLDDVAKEIADAMAPGQEPEPQKDGDFDELRDQTYWEKELTMEESAPGGDIQHDKKDAATPETPETRDAFSTKPVEAARSANRKPDGDDDTDSGDYVDRLDRLREERRRMGTSGEVSQAKHVKIRSRFEAIEDAQPKHSPPPQIPPEREQKEPPSKSDAIEEPEHFETFEPESGSQPSLGHSPNPDPKTHLQSAALDQETPFQESTLHELEDLEDQDFVTETIHEPPGDSSDSIEVTFMGQPNGLKPGVKGQFKGLKNDPLPMQDISEASADREAQEKQDKMVKAIWRAYLDIYYSTQDAKFYYNPADKIPIRFMPLHKFRLIFQDCTDLNTLKSVLPPKSMDEDTLNQTRLKEAKECHLLDRIKEIIDRDARVKVLFHEQTESPPRTLRDVLAFHPEHTALLSASLAPVVVRESLAPAPNQEKRLIRTLTEKISAFISQQGPLIQRNHRETDPIEIVDILLRDAWEYVVSESTGVNLSLEYFEHLNRVRKEFVPKIRMNVLTTLLLHVESPEDLFVKSLLERGQSGPATNLMRYGLWESNDPRHRKSVIQEVLTRVLPDPQAPRHPTTKWLDMEDTNPYMTKDGMLKG